MRDTESGLMSPDKILHSSTNQVAQDQQNYRQDMRDMQARRDARQVRSDKRLEE